MKEKYYVNIANGAISKEPAESDGAFAIYANDGDIGKVQEKVASMDDANRGSYIRAHVPYYPAESGPENARYDKNLKELYAILYELGDDQTKEHIDSIDILNKPGDNLV